MTTENVAKNLDSIAAEIAAALHAAAADYPAPKAAARLAITLSRVAEELQGAAHDPLTAALDDSRLDRRSRLAETAPDGLEVNAAAGSGAAKVVAARLAEVA